MPLESVNNIIGEFERAGLSNVHMPDFICINGKGCWRRFRAEEADAFASSDGDIAVSEARKIVQYDFVEPVFSGMPGTILDYVTYVGPVRAHLSLYVNHIVGGNT